MNNILLVSKDMNYCKKIINLIHKEFEDVRISSIASNYEETLQSLLNYNIDYMIVDLPLKEYKEIEACEFHNKEKLKNSVILVLQKENNTSLYSSPYINNVITERDSKLDLLLHVKILINSNEKVLNGNSDDIIIRQIKNELRFLGYNMNHRGSRYLLEAIYLLDTLPNYYDDNLEKDIYPIIGMKTGKSVNTIRCAIRYATDMMTLECDQEKLMEYLGMKEYEKPGAKQIIEKVLEKIKCE